MSFSRACGVTVVPLVARLVLGVAFVTVGYDKVTGEAEFDPSDAAILRSIGVGVSDADGNPVAHAEPGMRVIRASYAPQDESGSAQDPPEEEGAIQELPQVVPPSDDAAAAGDEAADVVVTIEPLPDGTYRARAVHRITLLCHDAGWPQPVLFAWAAGLTELVGGGLVLVGFLSRIWALGLSIAMGSAFYLVSMRLLNVHTANPLVFAQSTQYATVVAQLALFALAFGVLLTGAGPVSVDHLLFRRGKSKSKASSPAITFDSGYVPPTPSPAPPAPFVPHAPAPSPSSAPAPEPVPYIPPVPMEEPKAPRPPAAEDPPPRRPL